MDEILPSEVTAAIERADFDPKLRGFIVGWATNSQAFSRYLTDYRLKIAKKLRGAKDIEDQRDVGLELYCAYSLLSVGVSVICEPAAKGPDLLVSMNGSEMNVETRRVRDREATDEWAEICQLLRSVIEPSLQSELVFLGVVASDHSYRYGRQSNLRPSIDVFVERYEQVKDFILAQLAARTTAKVEVPVAPLPEGFARLRIEEHHKPVFCAQYPVGQGDEPRKLLRIACEKSRQVVQGQVNLIVLWIDALGETCDDFEVALGIREREMAANNALFAKRMKYTSPEHASMCWQACSAFLVHDCQRPLSQLYGIPDAERRLSGGLRDLVQRSSTVPFRP